MNSGDIHIFQFAPDKFHVRISSQFNEVLLGVFSTFDEAFIFTKGIFSRPIKFRVTTTVETDINVN